MRLTTPSPAFEDERGMIKDILENESVDSITVIDSKKGVVRGNHYHKETVQWTYLQSGKIKILTQFENGPVVADIMAPGDLSVAEPMEKHAVIALEDSVFFVFTRGPRSGSGYENDTYRLDTPLQELTDE